MATEKNAAQWRGGGMMHQGCIQAMTGKAWDAIEMIPSGIAAWQSSGSIVFVPWYMAHMARAHAELGRFDEAWRHIVEALAAVEKTGETWCESDIHRIAGEIALLSSEQDISKAQTHFERALAIAREQKAKSWELRATTSMARLLRDHGKGQTAREILAPVYDWFTEGFNTRDLKEAKALLDDLAQ
jgi:predicted ATPase